MFTLHEMNKKGFVHGDAHFGNILMDSLLPNEPSTAAYEFSDGSGVDIDTPQIPLTHAHAHTPHPVTSPPTHTPTLALFLLPRWRGLWCKSCSPCTR